MDDTLEVIMALNGITTGTTFALQDNVPGCEIVEPGGLFVLRNGGKPIAYGIHVEGFRNHPTYNVLVVMGMIEEYVGQRGLLWVSDKDLGDKYWL